MAQLLAPYNNSMRLGQGFNSFTQQICMNDAVVQGEPVTDSPTAVDDSKGISQIVSYSSRFVDKLSDVTDAMNVSASLSIKTGTIGGSASGTYIDSDKFKSSDLNFFIQVKVTNQSHMARDYTKFQKLKEFPLTKFTEIYGVRHEDFHAPVIGNVCLSYHQGFFHLRLGGRWRTQCASLGQGQRQV
jgi:hypothetical protein